MPPLNPVPLDGLLPVVAVPVIAAGAYALRAMSGRGAIVGSAVAVCLTVGLGWTGLAMLATLLVLGTLLSARSHRGRGGLQAFCNGGVAALLALLAPLHTGLAIWGGAGALAAALSDTVAGEIGSRFGGAPRLLLLGPPVPPRSDGGMTPLGTLAGLVAALPIPLLALWMRALGDLRDALAIALAAFLGNLADSLLGATVQRRLGARGNDLVNLAATAFAAGVAMLLYF